MFENLTEIYYSPQHPGSFGGSDRLSKYANVSKSEASRFLKQQDTYTKHKAVKHKFLRCKINSPNIDYLWQSDLITITKGSKQNHGVKYLLTVIDCVSRFAFARALTNKRATTTAKAFASIFEEGRKPKYIQTDEGTEFMGSCKRYLEDEGVKIFDVHSELKAAMVERFKKH